MADWHHRDRAVAEEASCAGVRGLAGFTRGARRATAWDLHQEHGANQACAALAVIVARLTGRRGRRADTRSAPEVGGAEVIAAGFPLTEVRHRLAAMALVAEHLRAAADDHVIAGVARVALDEELADGRAAHRSSRTGLPLVEDAHAEIAHVEARNARRVRAVEIELAIRGTLGHLAGLTERAPQLAQTPSVQFDPWSQCVVASHVSPAFFQSTQTPQPWSWV